MKNNLLFVILCTFLLIKASISCQNALSEDEIFEDADTCAEETEKMSFRHAVITKLTALADEPIKLGIKLIEDTYADQSDDENVNKLLTQILNDYHKITPDKPTTKVEIFLRLSYVFDFVSGPISDKLQNRNVILHVKAALERHNLKSVTIEFQKKYDEFLNWLIPETDVYNKKLNSKEQLEAKELKELLLQYKEETDLQKKFVVTYSIVTKLE